MPPPSDQAAVIASRRATAASKAWKCAGVWLLELDGDEDLDVGGDLRQRDLGAVAADDAGVLEALQALPERRGGQVDLAGEVGLGDAAVGGEDGEDLQVAVVELEHQAAGERADAGGAAGGEGVGGDGGVLGAGAGEVADGDGVGGRAAGGGAGDDGAELGRGAAGPVAGGEGGAELAEGCGLGGAVADVEVGGGEDGRVELVLLGLVGAHGGDVQAGVEPAGLQDRGARGRGGDDELALGDEGGGVGFGVRFDAEGFRQVGGGGGGLCRVAAPDEGAGERADEVGGLELQAGLDAGAEDAGGLDGGGGHVAGGDGAGGGGADVGQVAVVEEEGLDEAGLRAEEDHQAVERGQAALGVVEEAGADLDREAVEAGEEGGLDVDLAVDRRQGHREHRGHDDAAGVEGGEGAFGDVDGGEVERDGAAEVGLGDEQDVMGHAGGLRG